LVFDDRCIDVTTAQFVLLLLYHHLLVAAICVYIRSGGPVGRLSLSEGDDKL
jgi:lipopolysaccharide/colanic/teichoic acid biosynthesis glycosyltransferase